MRKLLAGFAAAAALCGASTPASALNIGGIDIPQGPNFEVASVFEDLLTSVGQTLNAYGEIAQINSVATSTLCGSPCELTYQITGYTVTALSGSNLALSGGTAKIFLDFGGVNFAPSMNGVTGQTTNAAAVAAATDGTLFLTLTGHAVDALGNTLLATGSNIGTASPSFFGSGLWDVATGPGCGIACPYFNTNSIPATFNGPFTDLAFTTSGSSLVIPVYTDRTCIGPGGAPIPGAPACVAGSADIRGLVLPEPGSLALLSLSLIGAGLISRRRRNR